MKPKLPFLYGAQYYRAPTPARDCWESDLANMRRIGMTDVKFWIQWRWSHCQPEQYDWSDLDALMDLAACNGLRVTLNFILDVAPVWLFSRFPDAMMVDSSGRPARPTANLCRQIGGYPGPCYCHPEALVSRRDFVGRAVEHFRAHPALFMWDVWNEPENNLMAREPDLAKMYCYCPHCHTRFRAWLRAKYHSVEKLNDIWGRCYQAWDEVELPYDAGAVNDFVDWREFHLDKLTAEAQWRLALVRERDPGHPAYLHVVTNVITGFNAVTCVDDFALAQECDVFAASVIDDDFIFAEAASAAAGKPCFNAEWHINFGSASMHPRILSRDLFVREALRQLGSGMFGMLFWQYRPELLGTEAPAWGVVNADGSLKPSCAYVAEFIELLKPHLESLMTTEVKCEAAIWRGRKNEIFHFCMDGRLQRLRENISGYVRAFKEKNIPFRFLSSAELTAERLDGVRLLIMPSAYLLEEPEAEALDAFVRRGGVVLSEAHLAGYNATTGRHSTAMPGCGLAAKWGIREAESCSSCHLPDAFCAGADLTNSGDAAKALAATGGAAGVFFPLEMAGETGCGAWRFARLEDDGGGRTLAAYHGAPVLVEKAVGSGKVFYAGTLLGLTGGVESSSLDRVVEMAAEAAGISRSVTASEVEAALLTRHEEVEFVVLVNRSSRAQSVGLDLPGRWRGVFYHAGETEDGVFRLPAGCAEFYYRERASGK